MCLHLSWQIAIIGCVQLQEGLVVNSLSAVGRQWPSRGETCSKGSKDLRELSPTAPNWGCWADLPNAAPCKMPLICFHIWLGSENNLTALRGTNTNKPPAEAQLNSISLACRLINELWPAPYLSAPKGWCASQECSGRGQPSPWRAWSHPDNSQCPGLLLAENPYSLWHGAPLGSAQQTSSGLDPWKHWSVSPCTHRLDLGIFIKREIPIRHAASTGWICSYQKSNAQKRETDILILMLRPSVTDFYHGLWLVLWTSSEPQGSESKAERKPCFRNGKAVKWQFLSIFALCAQVCIV